MLHEDGSILIQTERIIAAAARMVLCLGVQLLVLCHESEAQRLRQLLEVG